MAIVVEVYSHEYAISEAKYSGETLRLEAYEATASGFECNNTCQENLKYTPIEPDGQEKKYYIPGVGLILEIELEDGARVELVDFTSAM